MWLLSRFVVVAAMQLMAPLCHILPMNYSGNQSPRGYVHGFVPRIGWELFSHWDGAWYRQIATSGYDYANDGLEHSVAFFPFFPLVSHAVMTFGLPFEIAGTLVNNLALLGALLLLYGWAKERHSLSIARWATAVLAWYPFSLYGTVLYTEGLFLLLTTAALRAFDHRQYVRAALWGAMATATRAAGTALIPAFFLVAWRERKSSAAYIASLATGGGLLLFSVYCALRFGDPLAFVHANRAWPQPTWLDIVPAVLTNADNLLKVVTFFGGSYLLWSLRAELPAVAVAYGFCSLALIQVTGALSSVNRYAYGIVSLALALGVLLDRHPRWGYALIGCFLVAVIYYTVQFTWWYWVA